MSRFSWLDDALNAVTRRLGRGADEAAEATPRAADDAAGLGARAADDVAPPAGVAATGDDAAAALTGTPGTSAADLLAASRAAADDVAPTATAATPPAAVVRPTPSAAGPTREAAGLDTHPDIVAARVEQIRAETQATLAGIASPPPSWMTRVRNAGAITVGIGGAGLGLGYGLMQTDTLPGNWLNQLNEGLDAQVGANTATSTFADIDASNAARLDALASQAAIPAAAPYITAADYQAVIDTYAEQYQVDDVGGFVAGVSSGLGIEFSEEEVASINTAFDRAIGIPEFRQPIYSASALETARESFVTAFVTDLGDMDPAKVDAATDIIAAAGTQQDRFEGGFDQQNLLSVTAGLRGLQ